MLKVFSGFCSFNVYMQNTHKTTFMPAEVKMSCEFVSLGFRNIFVFNFYYPRWNCQDL